MRASTTSMVLAAEVERLKKTERALRFSITSSMFCAATTLGINLSASNVEETSFRVDDVIAEKKNECGFGCRQAPSEGGIEPEGRSMSSLWRRSAWCRRQGVRAAGQDPLQARCDRGAANQVCLEVLHALGWCRHPPRT